jgi:molybdopterin converting factor small subunit
MQLRFYANMRTVIGGTSLEITDVHVDTFRKLLYHLIDIYPNAAFHLLDEQGQLRQDVPVYVDGRNPRLMKDGIDSPLQPDSVVSFFSPIASGKMNVEVLRDPNPSKRENKNES